MKTKFTEAFIANELGIENDRELQEVTQISNEYGRLPDTTKRGTKYLDGFTLIWVWTDPEDSTWDVHHVYGYRSYY